MPSSIPYDPSLVLMSVVTEAALLNVQKIAELQSPVDTAHDELNSLISSKRSLTMTKVELRNLGVGTKALDEELRKLNGAIEKAAATYTAAKMEAEPQILESRKSLHAAHPEIESPVDYTRSEIKTMPLAADTMNMDVQYFSFGSDSQSSSAYSAQIASFVSASAGNVFGAEHSAKLGKAASDQVSSQVSSRSIQGTLVLSVSCTHKNASIVAPFVLHVDKAIKVWNRLFPGKKLDPTNATNMLKCAMEEGLEDKQHFSIISGTTFGSSFVGMVHVLSSTDTSISENMQSAAQSMQRTMEAGSWFANVSGKSSLDSKFARDVKNLFSQHNVQSCVTVLSTEVQSPASGTQVSIASMAEAARTGGQASEMRGKTIESSLSGLMTIDDGENKILDVNSMMTALDDYLKKASAGEGGVPINYYLKDIDQKMLAQMWAAKYYPGKFMAMKYDDTEDGGPADQKKDLL